MRWTKHAQPKEVRVRESCEHFNYGQVLLYIQTGLFSKKILLLFDLVGPGEALEKPRAVLLGCLLKMLQNLFVIAACLS